MDGSAYSQNVVLTPEMRQYFGRLFAPLSGIESGADHWQEEFRFPAQPRSSAGQNR